MRRISVDPITFWSGLVLMLVGVLIEPAPQLNISRSTYPYIQTGILLGWIGFVLLLFSYAFGTSRARTPRGHADDVTAGT